MKAISGSENPVISVEAALEAILGRMRPVEAERVPLARSFGRVLAETIISGVNVPPFTNSAMDGYALIARDSRGASPSTPVRLQVVEHVPAGATPTQEVIAGAAVRIMTGAPMPSGADAVIRFEETSEYIAGEGPALRSPATMGSLSNGLADHEVLIYYPVKAGDNVRLAGEDIKIGQILLEAGHRLRPQDVGVLAATGQAEVQVYRRPRVAILATGDELVAVDEPIGPGKIRNSNEYVQAALVEKYGGEAVMLGIARDTVPELTAKIYEGLAQQVDLFLTSAGVSIGDFDMVKTVLAGEGEMQFWQVGIKPGKPLAFGWLHHRQAGHSPRQIPLIGLPGNPVAAMVAFEVFARPAILKLAGQRRWEKRSLTARLDEPVSNSGRRHYMRAFVYRDEEGYRVTTRDSSVQVQGSGILTSMVWANCLVIVPEGETNLAKDTLVNIWLLD